MKEKIREYVNYRFRFNTTKESEDLKEEIISNISDRYDELFEKTQNEEFSYIQAIKSIGDFPNEKEEERIKAYKPSIPEMFLVTSIVLAIFGVIIVLLSSAIGAVTIMVSISLFAVGAVYLYQQSQYIKENEYNIDKHNAYITKIFAYVKTDFIFWAISISYLLTVIIHSIIVFFLTLSTMSSLTLDDLSTLFIISVVIFIIVFCIIIFIFKYIYEKLIEKYKIITGKNSVKSKIEVAKEFIFGEEKNNSNKSISLYIIPIISIIGALMILFTKTAIGGSHYVIFQGLIIQMPFFIGRNSIIILFTLMAAMPSIVVIVLAVLSILKIINNKYLVAGTYLITIVLFGLAFAFTINGYFFTEFATGFFYGFSNLYFIASFLITLFLLILNLVLRSKNNKNRIDN